MAGKLQFMTINNLQEFLNLHNVQIDKKISDAVANSIKTVSQSEDGYTIYFYTKTAPVTIEDAVFTLSLPQPLTKIDKVKNAVEGNIPSLSKDGNLVDSGKSVTDFDAAGAADTAKAEVLGVVEYVSKALADSDLSQYATAEALKACVGRVDAIEKKIPTLEAADTANTEAINGVKTRVETVEGKVKAIEDDLAVEKPKIAKNATDIAALQGLVGDGYEAIPSEKIQALFKVTE